MRRLFILLPALWLPIRLSAQTAATTPPARQWGVSANLFPLIASGYHVSVERRWHPASRSSVVLTPQWYRGPVNDFTSDLHDAGADRVQGFGAELQHRIYLGPESAPLDGFYVSYGASYQHFRMQFRAASWQPELGPDGLYYYEYRQRPQTETIDRFGAVAVLGRQWVFPGSPFFLDAYLGMGLRTAGSRATLPGNHFATSMSDYGHEGYYLPVGFRLGVML
ncbi:hypothetical protein [Hymenobacter pini]|uniref:hypothetical protein n=1 Tax=Hymenobacter pini TaxID=2880879 RepID=UPI001CF1184C|nr:hypothetical protein [Hymenobacter pini]MCA8832730.1 hypothetical protein [Hymenobacter pini]